MHILTPLVLAFGGLAVASTTAPGSIVERDPSLTSSSTTPCTTRTGTKKIRCGTAGVLHGTPKYAASPSVADSVEDCRVTCFATTGCVAFSFNTTSQACSPYSGTPASMGFKKSAKSTLVFYSKKCFKCPVASTNILINGDFEDATQNQLSLTNDQNAAWQVPTYYGCTIEGPGDNSSNALHFPVTTSSNSGEADVAQYFSWPNGTTSDSYFTLSFDYIVASDPVYFPASFNAGDYYAPLLPSTAGQWAHKSTLVKPDRLDYGQVYFQLASYTQQYTPSPNDFWIDNVVFTPTTGVATTAAPGATEALTNGDFEASTTDFSPWQVTYNSGGTINEVQPGSGGTGSALSISGASQTIVSQTMTLVAGQRYIFSMDYNSGGAQLSVLINTPTYGDSQSFGIEIDNTNGDWVTWTRVFDVLDSTLVFGIQVAGTVSVDNVSVKLAATS